MEQRIYHGTLTPEDVARSLIGEFDRGTLSVQKLGHPDHLVVQIASRSRPQSGGQTALSVDLRSVADGIAVQVGQQAWLGVAASLGMTALSAWRNPWSLLGRLDDLAQDLEYLQLAERVWEVVETAARAAGASLELSERLRRVVCLYCDTANPVGEPSCVACGAPLGDAQPRTCLNCGFVVRSGETSCPNCKRPL
ncbi:MAG TPA: zinc ribbon domain-containing protein [Firmicutes bacterium]|nr:zinc ribbon domain-containing protein [Bacillota bacterium]